MDTVKPRLRRLAAAAALSLAGAAFAEDGDTAAFAVRAAGIGASDLAAPADARLTAREYQASAVLPARRIGVATIGLGFDYQYTRYEYDGIAGRDRDLHRLQLPVRMRGSIDGWTVRATVAPGLATSSNVMKRPFRRATGEDVFVTGALSAARPFGRHSSWSAGVAFDRTFGRPTAYPTFALSYRDGARWRWRLGYPRSDLTWAATDRLAVHARAFPAGSEWHVTSDDFTSTFAYRVRALRTEIILSRRIGRALTVDVTAGYEFARNHDFVADGGARIDTDADARMLLSIGFRYGAIAPPVAHSLQP